MPAPDDQRCSRCDDPIAHGDGVTVPGLTASGPAHEACVPDEYRDFMRIINHSMTDPPATEYRAPSQQPFLDRPRGPRPGDDHDGQGPAARGFDRQ